MNQVRIVAIIVVMAAFGAIGILSVVGWAQEQEKVDVKKEVPLAGEEQGEEERAPVRFPDLVVSVVTTNALEPGQVIPDCKVMVKNVGEAVAPGTKSAGEDGYTVDVILSSDETLPVASFTYSPYFSEDVFLQGGRISVTPDLKPNQSKIFSLPNVLLIPADTPPGGYCVGAVINSANTIDETNEDNNTACSRVTIGQKLPDLIVKHIALVDECTIRVTLKNVGSAGVPDSGYDMSSGAGVQMYNGNQPWGALRLGAIDRADSLRTPGGEVSYIWPPEASNLQLGPGIHSIRVIVDLNSAVAESNEHNNDRTERLSCGQGRADLVVSDIRLNEKCKIQVTVKNLGDAGVPDAAYDPVNGVIIQANSGSAGWGGYHLDQFDTARDLQDPGGSVRLVGFKRALKKGEQLRLTVQILDPNSTANESNTGNNSRTSFLLCQ